MSEEYEYKLLEEFIEAHPPVWYRRLLPWLPCCFRVKNLRLFVVEWHDITSISTNAIPWITKKHCIDVLVPMHREWYHLPISGFQIWY